ncbi:unnamed protein product (macronuclear) [Paramecium tetraurelia]|uniref:EGF-like domain-containing protein n=1 Tax=Paramecium tetraurelia TaxID=5888 RepID=A0DIV4_PARTE|nr:uncharacterized protein GSPATT00017328001 [Paramecium tetraurelia]CAK82971.1 unnamed protein product [Paramecium tetraurelia]|eukprot:XP_001450368.1 hypothetical protein (macronuclear) [Paramecium tetraurelia strain d4-2]
MISFVKQLILVNLWLYLTNADWIQIDSNFNDTSIDENDWKVKKSCDHCGDNCEQDFQSGQCDNSVNSLDYALIKKDKAKLYKSYEYQSFQTQIIFDVYFNRADRDKFSSLSVDYHEDSSSTTNTLFEKNYKEADLTQKSNRICTGGSDTEFDQYTVVSSILDNNAEKFWITFCLDPEKDDVTVFIRNLLIYVNTCYPTCKTCNGAAKNQCQSCYYNSVSSGQCSCPSDNQFAQTTVGCRQECDRDYFIAQSDNICVPDRRIKSNVKYFDSNSISSSVYPRYTPFVFIPDLLKYSNTGLIYDDCDSKDFVGEIKFCEGMFLRIQNINALKFIRLRITLYLFSLQTDSKIEIYLDDILQSQIIAQSGSFQFNSCTKIYSKSDNCDSKPYSLVRIEAILKSFTNSPILTLQGKLQQNTESWGFNNVTIDTGLCQENCKICSNFNDCSQCETGYILYQNGCISQCPVHSSNCVDYADMIPYSRYLAKGFYDMNMTSQQVSTFFDSVTNPTTNFKTGQKFSFFPKKFVLGGVMVWNNAKYIKSWTISKPHYAVTIRFNLTYGDEYSGNFYYQIGTDLSTAYAIPPSGGQNVVGRNKQERTRHFNILKTPFKTSPLNIEFQCTGGDSDIRQQFCAISEYFIVVHYCPPFCADCSSDTVCITWESGKTSSLCASNQFQTFNSATETYTCNTCTQIGCLTCNNLDECTSCQSTQFSLQNGVCQCFSFYYLSGSTCLKCNKFCENCNGSNKNNCLSCVTDYYRAILFNTCVCQIGYYDDGVNLPCLPICGDTLVVNGEDCDDGNNNPFDGCHNCKFTCDEPCANCVSGKCLICQDGYKLLSNKCAPICGDSIVAKFEQCEDNNLTPYDGCFKCKFSCSSNCIDCYFGTCLECDETNGWYLQNDKTCATECGDSVKVPLVEYCDDANSEPMDGCDQCVYSCNKNCVECIKGTCVICEDGYTIERRTNTCIVDHICGDNQITKPMETCDDQNNLRFDGCYKCQFSCQDSCTNCQNYGCLECNTEGWEYNDILLKCEPICGDGIILINYEECDDLISVNCQSCRFQCQDTCELCYKGLCHKCKKGWQLDKFYNSCYPISGDSLIVGSEECDDFNRNPYDGCYQSQYQCQMACIKCELGKCKQCQNGYFNFNNLCYEIIGDGLVVGKEQCDDVNLSALDGCFQTKFDCPQNCSACVKGECLDCNKSSGHQVDILRNICISKCGDKIKSIDEDCDDGNDIAYDGCFNCQFQCDLYCYLCFEGQCKQCQVGYYLNKKKNHCFSICGDGISTHDEECDDGNNILNDGCSDCKSQCHQQCTTCIDNHCYECKGIGWELNLTTRQCQPVCGDGVVIGDEQCDDGNDLGEDGCFECYYQCQNQCTKCLKGFCEECDTMGWYLEWNQCFPYCGDKLVVGNEECDDGNIIPYDGCYQCKYQCQEQCTDCQKGVCYKCEVKGWTLLNNLCNPLCGDGYVVQGYEQCDDGNNLQYDGCYECFYQCEEICTFCDRGICYECNKLGWVVENHHCLPYCGDGLVIGYEKCDDMNDDFNDGCHLCQFACDQFCIDCQEGVCQQCEPGRNLDKNTCQTKCGDGYFVKLAEQCDDGNNDDGDGCNRHCVIETNFICLNTEGSFSNCFYSKIPEFKLNLITKVPEDYEEVDLVFDQKMKFNENLVGDVTNNIETEIINLRTSDYFVTQSIQKSSDEISEIVIRFMINFYVPIDEPVFKVKFLNNPIISEFNLTLEEDQKSLQLLTPMVLTADQKAIAESATVFNEAIIYSLAGISSICLLTGSTEIFWNLMDQLQYLSYIKYVNIQFPNNLNIYFDIFNLVTISPLMKTLGIDSIFNSLDGEATYFVKTQSKFEKDEINAYFFINFQSFLFCFITAYSGYLLTYYSHCALYRLGPYYISKVTFGMGKKILEFRKTLKKKAKEFYYNGILRIFMSNAYDVCFATTIQLNYFQKEDPILIFNSYLSLFVYLSYLGISIYSLSIMHHFNDSTSIKKKIQYDALFDGIQENKSYWITQYNSILLIKKQIFISIIVFMQNEGQLQTVCVAINQSFFLGYMILNKPLSNSFEYYKMVSTESILIFNVLTFLIYSNRVELELTLQQCINIGWVHIFTSTMILAISLIFDLIQQMKLLIQKLKPRFGHQSLQETGAPITLFY